MAIKTKEEILASFRAIIGEDVSDGVIAFTEDLSDTLSVERGFTQTDIDERIAEVEANWRKKYRDRFFSGEEDGEEKEEQLRKQQKKQATTIDDLFTYND